MKKSSSILPVVHSMMVRCYDVRCELMLVDGWILLEVAAVGWQWEVVGGRLSQWDRTWLVGRRQKYISELASMGPGRIRGSSGCAKKNELDVPDPVVRQTAMS